MDARAGMIGQFDRDSHETHPKISTLGSSDNAASLKRDVSGNMKYQATSWQRFVTEGRPQLSSTPCGARFSTEDDLLIVHLKEHLNLPWGEIAKHFPERSEVSVQTRYSRKLVGWADGERPSESPSVPKATEKRVRTNDCGFTLPSSLLAESSSRKTLLPKDCPLCSDSTKPLNSPLIPLHRASSMMFRREYQRSLSSTNDCHEHGECPLGSFQTGTIDTPIEIPDDTESASASASESSRSQNSTEHNEIYPSLSLIHHTTLQPKTGRKIEQTNKSKQPFANQTPATGGRLPYLSQDERLLLVETLQDRRWDTTSGRRWQSVVTHSDFNVEELETIERSISKVLRQSGASHSSNPFRDIRRQMKDVTEDKIHAIASHAKHRRCLSKRSFNSVKAFLLDTAQGTHNRVQCIERISAAKPVTTGSLEVRISSFLRRRELGGSLSRGCASSRSVLITSIKNSVYDTLGPSLSYIGTSGDVNTVAWSPKGNIFAIGSASLNDENSVQYNLPKNLLLGNVARKFLVELPDHYITPSNSSQAMHASQDHRLFSTISMVEFSPDGQAMYSAGFHDKFMRVWDVSDEEGPQLLRGFEHKGGIDVLTVSCTGLVATGCRRYATINENGFIKKGNSIKVLKPWAEGGNFVFNTFTSERVDSRPGCAASPSALKFEPTRGDLLLAGFSSNTDDDGQKYGDICLWDVTAEKTILKAGGKLSVRQGEKLKVSGSARHCFDCTWSTLSHRCFAVGTPAAGLNVNKGCRSVVRIHNYQRPSNCWGATMELECPALDINDVVFCPYDANYIAAGCTDGKTYIWDVRRPDDYLFSLNHRESLQPLDESRFREEVDTGIRFCAWGANRTRLYTGSSDGVVKSWDITRAPSDAHTNDVVSLNSGVMCGAFSPDKSSLLIGEVCGAINLLEVGREDTAIHEAEKFRIIEAPIPTTDTSENLESGVAAARTLVQSKQISIRPMGSFPVRQAVQGPNYRKPTNHAADVALLRRRAADFQHRLIQGSSSMCNIAACRDGISKITFEEEGDSCRSVDRIPDQLRLANRNINDKMMPGLGKCAECGRPARVRLSNTLCKTTEAQLLCELCDFTCFRCGGPAILSKDIDVVKCFICDLKWAVDALGYSVIYPQKTAKTSTNGIDSRVLSQSSTNPISELRPSPDDELDEVNDLADYYHSLWLSEPDTLP